VKLVLEQVHCFVDVGDDHPDMVHIGKHRTSYSPASGVLAPAHSVRTSYTPRRVSIWLTIPERPLAVNTTSVPGRNGLWIGLYTFLQCLSNPAFRKHSLIFQESFALDMNLSLPPTKIAK